jgi:hypothetical protein
MGRLTLSHRSSARIGLAARIFGTLFCGVFLLAGLFLGVAITRETYQKVSTHSWKPGRAMISSSDVQTEQNKNQNYKLTVRYQYSFEGKEYSSDQFAIGYSGSSDYTKSQRLLEKYPADSSTTCYVNPKNPAEAVLERSSLWIVFGLLFPIPFVLVGAGGIYFLWRGGGSESDTRSVRKPISETAAMTSTPRYVIVFFTLFLVAGAAALAGFFVRPALKVLQAKNWRQIPCVVISSEVRSHDSDDGTTYSVNILYAYEVNGKEYKSNRYQFMAGSSSGYDRKATIVRRHPPGTKTVCFVNPDDPTEAVLERGFTKGLWFGLIPLVFVAAGVAGIFSNLRKLREQRFAISVAAARRSTAMASRYQPAPTPDEDVAGPVTLKPKSSPLGKLLGTIIVAIFWNGIVSVFVYQVLEMWRTGHGGALKWFLTLFLTPFVAVGLATIGGIGYYFVALFNPRPRLSASTKVVPLGGTIQLDWQISGRLQNIRELRIFLEGREEATYRRGTTTTTDKEVFETLDVVRIKNWSDMRSGTGQIRVPTRSMHSFSSENNKIIWVVHLTAEVEWRPDLNEEFPITVLPLAVAALEQS